MLPPGGLSLCPVDADAGAHGVLLGDPLASLIAARASALQPRRELHGRFGRSVALNAALMVGAALRGAPPWAITAARHGANFLLLEQSARLARHSTPIPAAAPHRSTSNRCEDEPHPQENR
jgi:cation transport ATPase